MEEERERWIRVSSEFDSDSKSALQKVSCKVWEGAAKLKLSFHSDSSVAVSQPRLSLVSKTLGGSLHLDLQDRNALVDASLAVGPRVRLSLSHDVKAQAGHVSASAASESNGYSLRLSSPVPPLGLPAALLQCPIADLHVDPDAASALVSVPGLCSAQYSDQSLRLRYAFKDHQLTFTPSLSLPSNAFSFAFKRRFTPSHKLSYWYHFDANDWSAVYKQNCGKLKLKAGYDSEVRMAWASLWVGDESGKTKASPLKMKLQLMLQVPQHDFRSSELLLKVKKRWDF